MAVLGGGAAAVCGSIADAAGVEAAVWALVLCMVPGWAVLTLESWARSPQHMFKLVLIATGVRVAIVAGGAVALLAVRPWLPRSPFLFSLSVMYLASLAWETWVLKRALPDAGGKTAGSAA